MDDLPRRLATSVSALVDRFKLRADGPYAGLGLAETSTVAQIAVRETPPTQGEVAAALGLPKTTMTSAVKRLESRGLVSRDRSDADGRARILRLTTEGAELARRLRDAQIDASAAMLEALTPADQKTLVRLIEMIAASTPQGDDG